jgi:hypothetical protein
MKPIPVKKNKMKLAARLEEHVRALADLGERSTRCPEALEAAAVFIENKFQTLGYSPVRQTFEADGISCSNIEAPIIEFRTDRPHILVGAHYDSAEGTPGADDNRVYRELRCLPEEEQAELIKELDKKATPSRTVFLKNRTARNQRKHRMVSKDHRSGRLGRPGGASDLLICKEVV